MGTLSPKALIKLWNECLDDARKNKRGIFGAKNSDAFMKACNAEYDKTFRGDDVMIKKKNAGFSGESYNSGWRDALVVFGMHDCKVWNSGEGWITVPVGQHEAFVDLAPGEEVTLRSIP